MVTTLLFQSELSIDWDPEHPHAVSKRPACYYELVRPAGGGSAKKREVVRIHQNTSYANLCDVDMLTTASGWHPILTGQHGGSLLVPPEIHESLLQEAGMILDMDP